MHQFEIFQKYFFPHQTIFLMVEKGQMFAEDVEAIAERLI